PAGPGRRRTPGRRADRRRAGVPRRPGPAGRRSPRRRRRPPRAAVRRPHGPGDRAVPARPRGPPVAGDPGDGGGHDRRVRPDVPDPRASPHPERAGPAHARGGGPMRLLPLAVRAARAQWTALVGLGLLMAVTAFLVGAGPRWAVATYDRAVRDAVTGAP